MNIRSVVLAGLLATLAACASQPRNIAQLDSARQEVERVGSMPEASQLAGQEVRDARASLAAAERAAEERKPVSEIVHLAYIAERRAQIAEARVQAMLARREVEKGEADRNAVLIEARERDAARAQQRAEQAQQLASSRAAMAEEAGQALEQARARILELEAKPTNRGMVLTLGDVLFETNSAALKSGADRTLQQVATFLAENQKTRVMIEGHTDSTGSDEYNRDLSRRRAGSVTDQLVSKGVARERIETVGLGEGNPVAGNDTAAGRQQNRRVEIVFSDMEGNFAAGAYRSGT